VVRKGKVVIFRVMPDLWFSEKQAEGLLLSLRVERTLHVEKTPYQDLAVFETTHCGRVLALDGIIQLTEADEFMYHEMLVHVPMLTHPRPETVLVVGGGDGGSVREILKHPSVLRVDLAELDERVVEASKRYFPALSSGFSDPRVHITFGDAIAFVKGARGRYDVMIVDSPDPIGMARGLFEKEFYESVNEALKPDGILCCQTESPVINGDVVKRVFQDLSSIFPVTRLYLGSMPTYQSGLWSYTLASKKYDPLDSMCLEDVKERAAKNDLGARYFTPEVFKASFLLPVFVKDLLVTS
jgi:spermidine synthase